MLSFDRYSRDVKTEKNEKISNWIWLELIRFMRLICGLSVSLKMQVQWRNWSANNLSVLIYHQTYREQ